MDSTIWWAIEWISGLLILALLLWMHHYMRQPRRTWMYVRHQGGGRLFSPKAMTLDEALDWLKKSGNGEVLHVDQDHGFIFYRPRLGP